MQWITPIEVTHKGREWRCVHCTSTAEVLRTAPATERLCKVDCWNVGTALATQVHGLNDAPAR